MSQRVISQPDTLVVAEDRLAGELADRLGAGRCSPFRDPYDALGALHDRPWSTVVLSGLASELPGMYRAVKRLQGDARVFAWCPSEARDALSPLVDDGLEGLFASPATPQELDRCVAAIDRTREVEPTAPTAPAEPAPESAPAAAPTGGDLSTAELIRLFRSAVSVPRLESAVGRLVRQQLQCEAYWRDGQAVPPGAAILLASEGDRPRALLADRLQRALTRRDREFLDSVQSCLSGLLAAARRMESMRHLARQYQQQARAAMAALTIFAGWAVWAVVAALIIILIFRIFSFYLGAIGGAI